MAKNSLITVSCLGTEIAKIGYDENRDESYFQYSPDFLNSGVMANLFPDTGILRRIPQVQVMRRYAGDTFRSLPPMIADSLPDMFGNIIFKEWLESRNRDYTKITVLQQLAYVSNRGMGALEYHPEISIPKGTTIDINEILEVVKQVLQSKESAFAEGLDHRSLLNVFKIGSSAGGARPKILIAEHKASGKIYPGDVFYGQEYDSYLIKLNLGDVSYDREVIEYSYYLAACEVGVQMMFSKLVDDKHFATLRFDRQDGEKQPVLTASGMTGWDFKDLAVSSYENLFELALHLKLPHVQIEQLYLRMVFNVVFCNADDHLKNHSFIYDPAQDRWSLAPAYDLTYSLNPLINFSKVSRALSINGKRTEITLADLEYIAERFTIKNVKGMIQKVQGVIPFWIEKAKQLGIPEKIIERIHNDFVRLI
ncbi:type II toxin-antitoxin system HipA family toxin [Sphingobacterium paludis]|uniref:Serine/threonine-protein kinase HipA n=1 Tax=Sphingobacterium paludis TaxID=1476465 RepID=A0A4R7CV83_9SPHI|nr:type II toxin-antitoxin system HipA family toxin [Sphingobacterium paludis]TDS08960.1 serine/threonine-protein kinase HipA [Sphingobacterium paludis]